MRVSERPSLKAFNTFRVNASAGLMITLENEEDLLSMPPFNPVRDIILGGGSNVLLASDVPGSVIHNRISGREIVQSDSRYAWIEAGAGENWHELVRWTLDKGLSGLENLSLIPGFTGAAPIQNIGAYGVELATVLESVTAWDLKNSGWKLFNRDDCRLAYRESRFKSEEPGRYLITSIRLRLDRQFTPRLDYAGLREELGLPGGGKVTAKSVSDAVTRLRRRKLPDPSDAGNAGSFFKNPVLGMDDARVLLARHPGLPHWNLDDGEIKLSAAWMIEQCGLKGYRQGDAAVSERHALVIVNLGAASGREILDLASTVSDRVRDRFGVRLEPEPGIIDFPE
jgi:UDP-N-acetylmuramate dehydrogenase